jgi:hypothetical protein
VKYPGIARLMEKELF